jgi:hypothetical protein
MTPTEVVLNVLGLSLVILCFRGAATETASLLALVGRLLAVLLAFNFLETTCLEETG